MNIPFRKENGYAYIKKQEMKKICYYGGIDFLNFRKQN
ncbi:hypothetical protein [Akkermansia phage Moulinsart]|nr:hypothetical protein [Akkermansia phage Moulinsart]